MEEIKSPVIQPPNTTKIKRIWRVALILGVVTFIEFVFAFSMESGAIRTSIFIMLTIVKAAYIVGEFMHLKYEVKVMMWAILLPMLFVVWLILALVYFEGGAILEMRY